MVRYHKMDIPAGRIKCGRIVKRTSGWYLSLFIDAPGKKIPRESEGAVGIDPGFKHLLTLSSGEKVEHPKELQRSIERLGRAQRGINRKLSPDFRSGSPIRGRREITSCLGGW